MKSNSLGLVDFHSAERSDRYAGIGVPQRVFALTMLTLIFILVQITLSHLVSACTVMRFDVNGRLVVARNHDWGFGEGMLIVNQRGVRKKALTPVNPVEWVSKYGSVSFVQFGREIPFAGMNERGLTVDLLQLNEAKFPNPDPTKSSVNVVQWVQYQLDTAATVNDVVASLEKVYPMPILPMIERVHYFVTDALGDVAVIEYINGNLSVQHLRHRDSGSEEAFEKCVLANSTLEDSVQAFKEQRARNGSELRFGRGVRAVQISGTLAPNVDAVDFAMESLSKVSQGKMTQWSLVYEPAQRRICFATRTASMRRWIDLDDLNFDSTSENLVFDLDEVCFGDLCPLLKPYTAADNKRIVDNAFDRMVPEGFARLAVKQLVLGYPSTLVIEAETQDAK